jgi:hypothetical protein
LISIAASPPFDYLACVAVFIRGIATPSVGLIPNRRRGGIHERPSAAFGLNQIKSVFVSFVVFVVPVSSLDKKRGTTKEAKDTKTIQRKKGHPQISQISTDKFNPLAHQIWGRPGTES